MRTGSHGRRSAEKPECLKIPFLAWKTSTWAQPPGTALWSPHLPQWQQWWAPGRCNFLRICVQSMPSWAERTLSSGGWRCANLPQEFFSPHGDQTKKLSGISMAFRYTVTKITAGVKLMGLPGAPGGQQRVRVSTHTWRHSRAGTVSRSTPPSLLLSLFPPLFVGKVDGSIEINIIKTL